MTNKFKVILALMLLCVLLLAPLTRSEAVGTAADLPLIPQQIAFSGGIQTEGAAIGPVSVSFSLFTEQSGGIALWMETQNVQLRADGTYSVLLGAETVGGIPQSIFASGEARWLEVSYAAADGTTDTQPRVLLVSVPYALKAGDAETLAGLPSSAFMLNPNALSSRIDTAGGLRKDLLVDSLPTAAISGSGTTNAIPKWTDGPGGVLGDSAFREVGGKFGVNTIPDYVLDMNAGAAIPGQLQLLLRLSRPGENIFTMWADDQENAELHLADGAGTDKIKLGTRSGDYRLDMNADTGAQSIIRIFRTGENILNLNTDASENSVLFLNNGTGTNTIKFNSAGDSFFTSGNMGVGTATPTALLDVAGALKATGFTLTGNGAGSGKVLTSDAAGVASWQTPSGGVGPGTTNRVAKFTSASAIGDSLLFDNGTNVGVGTITPGAKLEVAGNIKSSSGGFVFPDASTQTTAASSNVNIRGINYLAGCDTCTVLADTDDQQDFYVNQIGSITIQSITCFSDAGSPTIDIRRDNLGAGTNVSVISGATMTCAQATASGGGGGTTVSGVSLQNNTLALNDRMDFVINSAGGVAKRITLVIKALVN